MAVKPDPRSQSSEEYAHSLLAQKQERDDRNFYHAKKQDRKATRKARLGLLGAWGTQAWNRRNFQKAQNLEESMIWEIASRTSDHNKAVADADTFIMSPVSATKVLLNTSTGSPACPCAPSIIF